MLSKFSFHRRQKGRQLPPLPSKAAVHRQRLEGALNCEQRFSGFWELQNPVGTSENNSRSLTTGLIGLAPDVSIEAMKKKKV